MQKMSKEKKLTTAQLALVLSMMTLLSKPLGFIRELLLTNYYGASYITDAYSMAVAIPGNLIGAIIGSVGTAYMPIFSKKVQDEGDEAGNKFTSQILNLLLIIAAIVVILGWIFTEQLVKLFAPGFTGETFELTVFYLKVAFLIVFSFALSQMCGAFLEYKGFFIGPSALGYLQNICIIAGIIVSAKTGMPKLLVFGITSGYLVSAFGKAILSHKHGFNHTADFSFAQPVREIIALAIPVFIGGSASEINTLIDRILASNLTEGSVSALQYGNLFANLISSLTISIFVTIIYPRLTQAFAAENYEKISDISERGINLIALLMVPSTLGCLVYSSQVIQVVYERGAFTSVATDLTSAAFFYYAIAMAFNAVRGFLDKIFFSMHDTVTPVKCSIVAVCFNIALNLILVKFMAHAGLALATSISQIIATFTEYFLFGKKFPQITLLKSKKKLLKIIIFSVISVGLSYAFYYFVGNAIWMPRMVLLGISVIIAVVAYMIFLIVFKFEELSLFKDLLGRK